MAGIENGAFSHFFVGIRDPIFAIVSREPNVVFSVKAQRPFGPLLRSGYVALYSSQSLVHIIDAVVIILLGIFGQIFVLQMFASCPVQIFARFTGRHQHVHIRIRYRRSRRDNGTVCRSRHLGAIRTRESVASIFGSVSTRKPVIVIVRHRPRGISNSNKNSKYFI